MAADAPQAPGLVRTLGLWDVTAVTAGSILGSAIFILSGSYEQLFQYVMFSSIVFHVITGLALFRLRRDLPNMPRPYRVAGYPWVPALFVVTMAGLVLNAFYERPLPSLLGIGIVALGVPIFRWRRYRLKS